jgi:hypothetical protein
MKAKELSANTFGRTFKMKWSEKSSIFVSVKEKILTDSGGIVSSIVFEFNNKSYCLEHDDIIGIKYNRNYSIGGICYDELTEVKTRFILCDNLKGVFRYRFINHKLSDQLFINDDLCISKEEYEYIVKPGEGDCKPSKWTKINAYEFIKIYFNN